MRRVQGGNRAEEVEEEEERWRGEEGVERQEHLYTPRQVVLVF